MLSGHRFPPHYHCLDCQTLATYQTLVLFMFPHLAGSGYIIYIAVPTVISYFVLFLSLAVPGHSPVDREHTAERFIGGFRQQRPR